MFIKSSSGIGSHPKLHTYQEGYLLPVLTAEELVFSARQKGIVRQFRDLADMPSDDYDRTYAPLITNFLELAQVLPHKTNGILGSLVNYSLARAAVVFQKYCQLRKNQTTPLLKFAVFSAALLKDIGRVVSNQRIVLTDEEGSFYRDWNPFSGSMLAQSRFYKMYPMFVNYLRIESESTPLLAKQLLTRDAFIWLSSDVTVFSDWLAALLGEEGVASKEITYALSLLKREDLIAVLNSLDGAEVNMTESLATEHGEAFYKWLKEAIDRDEIKANKEESGVYVVPEGVLITDKVIQKFIDVYKVPVQLLIVRQQFGNLMGIIPKGPNDFLFNMLFGNKVGAQSTGFAAGGLLAQQQSAAIQKGIVIPDTGKIFVNKETPEMSHLKSSAQTHSPVLENHREPPKDQPVNQATLKPDDFMR